MQNHHADFGFTSCPPLYVFEHSLSGSVKCRLKPALPLDFLHHIQYFPIQLASSFAWLILWKGDFASDSTNLCWLAFCFISSKVYGIQQDGFQRLLIVFSITFQF